MMKRILGIALVLALALGLAACSSGNGGGSSAAGGDGASSAPQAPGSSEPSQFADYPSKSIELIVPSAAGTGFDALGRKIAEILPKYLDNNVTIYVSNKNAGGGAEGWTAAYGAEPDGYTLLFYGVPDSIIAQEIYERDYDVMEMTSLAAFTYEPSVLLASNASECNSLEDVMAAAKNEPVVFGDSGAGGSTHLESLVLTNVLDIPMRSVHFESVPEVITSWERNETEFLMISLPTAITWVDSDSAKPLCITSEERSDLMPDVPTIYEVDGVSEEQADQIKNTLQYRRAIWAPPGMDQELVDILVTALEKVATDADFLEWAESVGREISFTEGEELKEVYQSLYDNHAQFMDAYKEAVFG